MKINLLNNIAKESLEYINFNYQLTDNLNDSDLIVVRSTNMHVLDLSDKTIAVARAGIGCDNIPYLDYQKRGIVVFNTPGANANAVKEMVILAVLLASRDIIGGVNYVKEQTFDDDIVSKIEKNKTKFGGREIYGRKIGVIGLGAVGYKVALCMHALGMEVYGFDVAKQFDKSFKEKVKIVDREEIYKVCDYITIHVPLVDTNFHMINSSTLKMMKEDAVLINLSRDAIVDDDDIVAALNNNKLGKYVTDFPNEKIMKAKNLIAIPHLGASTEDSERNCAIMAIRELNDYAMNGNITNSINFGNCSAIKQGIMRITLIHEKEADVLSVLKSNSSIANITSSELNGYVYTIIDLYEKLTDYLMSQLEKNSIRMRIIKY